MIFKINRIIFFAIVIFAQLDVSAQDSERWYLEHYISQKKWEVEYVSTNRKGDTTSHLLYYDSIVTDNKKVRIKYFKFKKKFSTIEHYELIDNQIEIKNGPHLCFDKHGKIEFESTFNDGVEAAIYYFNYYPNGLPQIKYEQKGKVLWNVIDYYLPNGEVYIKFGDFKNGEGTLNMITDYKIESPEDFPITYQYYFNEKGKQKRRVIN